MTVLAAGPSSPSPFPLRFPSGSLDSLKRSRVARGIAFSLPILFSYLPLSSRIFFLRKEGRKVDRHGKGTGMRDTGHGWGGSALKALRESEGRPESEWRAAPRADGTAAAQRSPLMRWRGAVRHCGGRNAKRAGSDPSAFWNIRGTERLSDHHSTDIHCLHVQPARRFTPCRVKARGIDQQCRLTT